MTTRTQFEVTIRFPLTGDVITIPVNRTALQGLDRKACDSIKCRKVVRS